jgi:Na+/proline symporter
MNLLTLGDYFKVRYGQKTELIASALMVPSYFGYIAGQLVALGLIINVVTGLEVWQGIVCSAAIVTLYTFIGGMWAISITDFVQSILIILGLIVLMVILSGKAGGVMKVIEMAPPDAFKFFPERNAVSVITYMAAWSVLGLGSIPSQDIFQRVMSSGSEKIAVRSCFYSAFFYITIALIPLYISLCVKILYPEAMEGDTQLTLPLMVLDHTVLPVQILFFGSLLSAIMSTTSSSILAPAAVLTENIIKPLMKKKPTDRHFLLLTRIAIVLVSMVATLLACVKSNIYELVGGASIFSLVSLFVPLILGLYWKRGSAAGAILSMFTGMITWGFFEWYPIAVPALVPALAVGFITMLAGSILWPMNRFS